MKCKKQFFNVVLFFTLLLSPILIMKAQEVNNMSLLGNFGKGEGQCKAVFALGTLTYYSVGEKFKIADFTTPAQPVNLGSLTLPSVIEDLVRSGNYTYIVAGDKMYIANVQNPTAISLAGNIQFSGYGEGIATKLTNVYVAAGGGGLRIIDAANPASPVEIAKVDTIGYSESVSISGNFAYVATGSKVRIINITNPAQPVYDGEITSQADYFQSVTVRGNYAYICDYGVGLRIVNVSNPSSPVVVSDFATGARTSRVQLDGNYAYVANGDSIKIVDVTDPAVPKRAGALAMTDRAVSVWVGVNHLFVADRNSGMKCVDISNTASPVLASSINVVPSATGTAYGVFAANDKAYVAYGSEGLRVIDVANPGSPNLLGALKFEGDSRQVVVKGNYAFVAARDGGVRVVDVSNPSTPVDVKKIATPRARGITIGGNYVYVAASDSGMAVIDVTDPANPVWVKSASAHYGEGIAVSGNVAAVSDYSNIKLYDITNPAAPVLKGETGSLTNGTAGMAISGNYLYVPDFDSLKIFDITDLNAPAKVYQVYCGASWDGSVVIEGKYAYVAAEENGVRVFDISNPLAAFETAYYKSSSSARGLAVNNGFVYVAQKTDGMTIYKNDLITGIEDQDAFIPSSFELMQNYPNPFNPETKIKFAIAKSSNVKLNVYNILGQIVANLVNETLSAGSHSVRFDGAKLSSGIYFYRLDTGDYSAVKKMILMK